MNTIRVILLIAALSALLLLLGYWIGRRTGVVMALVFSLIMNFGSYWFSDQIILRMYDAVPVTESQAPDLYDAVKGLSAKAGIPMPRVYILPEAAPNAFATGRNEDHAAVAVTSGILKILDRDELEGVIAHELSHIRHKDILVSTMAATLAGAVVLLSRWTLFFGGGDDSGMLRTVAVAVIAPVAATLIQMAVSRSREYQADAGAARVSGKPEALAGALAKLSGSAQKKRMDAHPSTAHLFIVNPLSDGAIMNLFSTHPPVEKRIERLMSMRQGRGSKGFF